MSASALLALLPQLSGAQVVGTLPERLNRVHTDTRSLQPGDLFVALKGDTFDAHDFLDVTRREALHPLVEVAEQDAVHLGGQGHAAFAVAGAGHHGGYVAGQAVGGALFQGAGLLVLRARRRPPPASSRPSRLTPAKRA